MFARHDKRRIYELINMYLTGNIDEKNFCDDFVPTYDQELDYDTLTEKEHEAFSDLGKIASRFSDFEEDLANYPGIYYTKSEVRKKIIETKEKLKINFDNFQMDSEKKDLGKPILEIREIAEDLGEDWLMCPLCQEAWQSQSTYGMVECPQCKSKLHNPRYKAS